MGLGALGALECVDYVTLRGAQENVQKTEFATFCEAQRKSTVFIDHASTKIAQQLAVVLSVLLLSSLPSPGIRVSQSDEVFTRGQKCYDAIKGCHIHCRLLFFRVHDRSDKNVVKNDSYKDLTKAYMADSTRRSSSKRVCEVACAYSEAGEIQPAQQSMVAKAAKGSHILVIQAWILIMD